MTEEQIKQNAEKYADQFVSRCFCGEWKDVVLNFTAGAHSRDEEIEKLKERLRSADESIADADKWIAKYKLDIANLEAKLDNPNNPWISVEERLPEKAIGLYELEEDERHKMVLFKTANGKLYRGYLDAEEIWRAFTVPYKGAFPIDSLTWSKVTNWMPIPELPNNNN